MSFLNHDFAARAAEIRDKRAALDKPDVAAQKAHAKGRAEIAELEDLRGKDLEYSRETLRTALESINRFDLLPADSDAGRELAESLQNVVVAFASAMATAAKRVGELQALEAEAYRVELHISKSRGPGGPNVIQKNTANDAFRRLSEQLRKVVAATADGLNVPQPAILLNALGAGIDDSVRDRKGRAAARVAAAKGK